MSIKLSSFVFFMFLALTTFSQSVDSLLKVYKYTTDRNQRYDIATKLTYIYMNQQNWDSTDLFLEKTFQLANTFKGKDLKARTYLLSGNVMNEKGMYLKADSLFDKGLQFAVRDHTKASLYISKFYLCIDLGNLENSLFYLQNARNHLKDTASALMPKYYLAYSTYYYYQGDLLNELRMLQKAQEFFQNANITNSINNKLATIYYNLHAYEEALDLSIKSRKLAQQNKNYIGELYALFSIMSNYLRLDDYEASKWTCFEAIQLKNTKKVSKAFGYVYYILGKVYLQEQQYDSSQYYFNKGIEISRLQHEDKELADNYEGIAELYFEQKRFKEAKLHIEKAYAITTPTFLGNNAMLAKIYAEEKNYQKAYELLNQSWTVLEKETRNRRDFKVISDLLNEKFEQEKKYKAEQLKAKNWLVYFIGILAVIFGILSILLLRVNRQRRQLSRTLKKKNKELEAIDKTKTEFFANISHELKTPLTLIINPIRKLLKQKNVSDENRYLMQAIEKNSLQLFDLTQQILTLTKFEVNKVDVEEKTIHFKKTLSKIYNNFESLAATRKINFKLEYEGDNDLRIKTDVYKFTTIIENLVSNALKYTPEQEKVVIKAVEKENTIDVIVKDTGRGIDKDDLEHVFDRYYQAKTNNRLIKRGTGIGLAICKEYVNLLRGTITVESILKVGSEFTVSLPKKTVITKSEMSHQTEVTSNTLFENTLITASTSSVASTTINPYLPTILLVEDNIDLQQYMQLLLKPSFNIIITNHGQEALSVLKNNYQNIQLIISDIMMPIMDGYEFLEQLKQSPNYVGIPVIMLTALSSTDNKLKTLRYGIDDYLLKPFVDAELLARIDNLLDNATQKIEYQQQQEEAVSLQVSSIKNRIITSIKNTSPTDNIWLEVLEKHVLENYSDYDFSVEQLAHLMAMSISSLFKKTKRIVGLTPMQYIKEVRLLEARKFLEIQKYDSVKAIVYSVGFRDVRNFSRNFKKRFGRNPSEYLG